MRSLLLVLILTQIPTFPKGCSEFYPDEPINLRIIRASGSTVQLAWDGIDGVSQYRVNWNSKDSNGVTTQESASTMELGLTIDSLRAGREYTFDVSSVDKGVRSTSASLSWTSATVFTSDAITRGEIRLYEYAAPTGRGSGLILDPDFGGPANASSAMSNPDVANIHIIGLPESAELAIGPAKGFTNLQASHLFRSDVIVSDTFFVVRSLEDWSLADPLDVYLSGKRTKPFEHIPSQLPSGNGIGFLVRAGSLAFPETIHYARVFVKPDSTGKLIRADDQGVLYIVVEVAWQAKSNYPYV